LPLHPSFPTRRSSDLNAAAEYALTCLKDDSVLGVGTGSTVDFFIDAIAAHRDRFRAAVSSSERSTQRMRELGIVVVDLNEVEDRSEEHTSELQSRENL